jgi:hypothetical protein
MSKLSVILSLLDYKFAILLLLIERNQKYEVRADSNGITFISLFVKIGQLVQKLKAETTGTNRLTHTQTA